jgi:hypothetical protein
MLSKPMEGFKEILAVIRVMAIPVALALIFAGSLTWLSATQEAAAFNRITVGPKVTTWDAVWLDLRVEAQR